ncbi:MAG: sterol desaturase family protein [Bacteroidetes bacterium]|nr:sterol desaturase family protein [Bacteroidota bacterium]
MKSPIFYAIPAFIILVLLEAYYGYRKKKNYYRLNDTISNFAMGIGSQLSGALSKGLIFGIYVYLHNHFALTHLPRTWWAFALCLVLFDFLFYWAHRLSHEINFFWGAHVAHHQSEEYNLSVALRQSWIHNLIAFFIFLPLPILGFDPLTFGIAAGVDTLYQFWIHTRAIGKMHPLIEYLFNTPSHHRVHHAVNPKYIDKNHAGVFIIWDRLFGTFRVEDDAEEITYGITTQFKSWNPVWANLHYYAEMGEKMKQMKWADRLRMITARPGWLPEYLGGFQSVKEVDKETYTKYDADTTDLFRVYGTVQFIITLAGSIVYLDHFASITTFYKWFFASILTVSIMIIGGIFERKKWTVWAEVIRLMLVLAALNSYYYYWYNHWLTIVEIVSATAFAVFMVWFVISVSRHAEEEGWLA